MLYTGFPGEALTLFIFNLFLAIFLLVHLGSFQWALHTHVTNELHEQFMQRLCLEYLIQISECPGNVCLFTALSNFLPYLSIALVSLDYCSKPSHTGFLREIYSLRCWRSEVCHPLDGGCPIPVLAVIFTLASLRVCRGKSPPSSLERILSHLLGSTGWFLPRSTSQDPSHNHTWKEIFAQSSDRNSEELDPRVTKKPQDKQWSSHLQGTRAGEKENENKG